MGLYFSTKVKAVKKYILLPNEKQMEKSTMYNKQQLKYIYISCTEFHTKCVWHLNWPWSSQILNCIGRFVLFICIYFTFFTVSYIYVHSLANVRIEFLHLVTINAHISLRMIRLLFMISIPAPLLKCTYHKMMINIHVLEYLLVCWFADTPFFTRTHTAKTWVKERSNHEHSSFYTKINWIWLDFLQNRINLYAMVDCDGTNVCQAAKKFHAKQNILAVSSKLKIVVNRNRRINPSYKYRRR